MPSMYHIDPEEEFILLRPTGRFTEEAFITLCQTLYDDPQRESHFSAIWDARDIDELVMDADVIPEYKTFLQENEHRITQGQVAVVTDRAIATTFASMLIQVGKQHVGAYEIFSTLDAAAEWIGVPRSALSDLPAPRRINV